ncbi:multiple epidermal growth factor-like domains protein 10 [Caerostris extrusa]|uniref:Multiple epidermal growth factor-like domains protein 10 n=1 Tax=Caerostris extrusa TaxID=172846 RepID=A0AAV4SST0_CAEEX|nr:multiple epidermal growth factor-like domains protein 10 [Caerostris extrusa]
MSGQFDISFVMQSEFGRLQSGTKSIINCYNDDYKEIRFSRVLNTGQFSCPFRAPRLPPSSQQFLKDKPVSSKMLYMPEQSGLKRFGAFQCKSVNQNITSHIVTLKLPPFNLGLITAELWAFNADETGKCGPNGSQLACWYNQAIQMKTTRYALQLARNLPAIYRGGCESSI